MYALEKVEKEDFALTPAVGSGEGRRGKESWETSAITEESKGRMPFAQLSETTKIKRTKKEEVKDS